MPGLHYSNQGFYESVNSIFLAGPTARNNSSDITHWRQQVVEYFRENDIDCMLSIPEPSDGNWPDYQTQIEWELYHLKTSAYIMFWVPRSLPDYLGLTTNVEFGRWYRDYRTFYGRPDNAEKIRYLDYIWNLQYVTKPIFNDLNKFCEFFKNRLKFDVQEINT